MTNVGPRSKIMLENARALMIDLPEEIIVAVLGRLRKGADLYGDASFDRTVPEVIAEIDCESYDIIGWWLVLAGIDRGIAMSLYRAGLLDAALAVLQVTAGLKMGMYGGSKG